MPDDSPLEFVTTDEMIAEMKRRYSRGFPDSTPSPSRPNKIPANSEKTTAAPSE